MLMPLQRTCSALLISLASAMVVASCSSQKMFRSAQHDLLSAPVLNAAHIGISLLDAGTGKYVYNYQGDKYFVPASNVKIPTCYAAMKYLGDSLTALQYFIRNADTVVISGTGSPDLLHPDFRDQPVLDFLKGFRQIIFSAKLYGDFMGNGWAWNDYKEYYMAQRSELPLYGNIATFKWQNENSIDITPSFFKRTTTTAAKDLKNGFLLDKPWDGNSFMLFDGADKRAEIPFSPDLPTIKALLADTLRSTVTIALDPLPAAFKKLHSRPLDSILNPMMHRSDNFFAEQMLLMVSQERLGVMSDQKIIDTLLKTDLADLPQKPRWVDGCGLSRYNLFTPQDFVAILNKMQKEFGMQRIKGILPTGGEGTISSYYRTESGYIYAKTGTLSGVVSLSGYLYTVKGKLIIFSILVNNHNGSATDVRRAVEKFLQTVRSKN